MTDTSFTPERAAGRSLAVNGDSAVFMPSARDSRAVVVADPGAQASPVAVGLQRDPDQLLGRFGPVLGIGDAIWRALFAVSAEIVCIAGAGPLEPTHIERLTRPLIKDSKLMLVNGVNDLLQRRDDRLTELVARPLVARYEPALAGLRQPLLGSFAARSSLLRTVPFPVGTGVRLSLLIDTIRRHGRDAVTEVAMQAAAPADRPLRELGPDAAELIVASHRRSASTGTVADERLAQPWNDLSRIVLATEERPPLDRILPDDGPLASRPASAHAAAPGPVAVIVLKTHRPSRA